MESVGTVVLLEKLVEQLVDAEGANPHHVALRQKLALKLVVRILGSSLHRTGLSPSDDQILQSVSQRMRRDADAEGAAAVLDLGQELARIMPDPRARADLLHTLQLVAADADQEREGDKPGSGPMGASADSLRKPWFGAPPARIGSLASQSFSLTEQRAHAGDSLSASRVFTKSAANASALGLSDSPAGLSMRHDVHNNRAQAGALAAPRPSRTLDVAGAARDAVAEAQASTALARIEGQLVRDLILAGQGVDGRLVCRQRRAAGAGGEGYALRGVPAPGVSPPAAALVESVGELGWLFRRVLDFLSDARLTGSAQRALKDVLQHEISEHYRMLAVLQEQATLAERDANADGAGHPSAMTLRRLSVWLSDQAQRMKLFAVMADLATTSKGGALLQRLGALGKQGDPSARALVLESLRRVARPMWETLVAFCCRGALQDPHGEFFVREGRKGRDDDGDFDLWRSGFALVPEMLPPLVSDGTAAAVLRAGKTVTFLRSCCGDDGWAGDDDARDLQEAMEALVTREERQDGGEEGAPGRAMASLVEEVASRLDARLKRVMLGEFRLERHLAGVRSYLLLGQSDFAGHLVEGMGPDLALPSKEISEMQLQRAINYALQASASASGAASADEALVQSCVRVSLAPADGASGWECVRLQYRVSPPVSTVLTPECMAKYARASALLLKLKRVEAALGAAWRGLKPNDAVLRSSRTRRAHDGDPDPEVQFTRRYGALVQQATLIRSRMAALVSGLLGYMMFDVIEVETSMRGLLLSPSPAPQWYELLAKVEAAKDLQGIIAAHEAWLSALLSRMMLLEDARPIMSRVDTLLEAALVFAASVCNLEPMAGRLAHLQVLKAQQADAEGALAETLDQEVQANLVQLQQSIDLMVESSRALSQLYQRFDAGVEALAELLKGQVKLDLRSLLMQVSTEKGR